MKYVWVTQGDSRVRPTHAANHDKIFAWNNPSPVTGHPGDQPGCRCFAMPVEEDIGRPRLQLEDSFQVAGLGGLIRVISQRIMSRAGKVRERTRKPAAQEQKPTPKKPADSATKKPIPKDKIFVRPKGVPKEWIREPSKRGEGVRWIDPKDRGTYVRIQKGKPNSRYPNQQKDYVRWQKNGQSLDAKGNPVDKNTPEAHIPKEEFTFKLELFKWLNFIMFTKDC